VQLEATSDIVLRPRSIEALTTSLTQANAERRAIGAFDLASLNRLIEHKPEDMTATAEAGLTLAELQKQLAVGGQWLPIDPPHPERLSLGTLLATNASGPRRFGYGTVRDYVIGLKVTLPDGRLISSGGKVVKNVAGYDLTKLFIGSRGSLGVIVEATFKLRPLPEAERLIQTRCESLDQAERLLEAVLDSDLTPVVLDLHQSGRAESPTPPLPGQRAAGSETQPYPLSFVVGFAGTTLEVDWQLRRAAELGLTENATLDYEREFWAGNGTAQKVSVLPSRLIQTLRGISAPFVARAGNGLIYHRGAPRPSDEPAAKLCQRLKQAWDPQNILPPPPL
jgi:FAD/FMN-containing dehydrogenase